MPHFFCTTSTTPYGRFIFLKNAIWIRSAKGITYEDMFPDSLPAPFSLLSGECFFFSARSVRSISCSLAVVYCCPSSLSTLRSCLLADLNVLPVQLCLTSGQPLVFGAKLFSTNTDDQCRQHQQLLMCIPLWGFHQTAPTISLLGVGYLL